MRGRAINVVFFFLRYTQIDFRGPYPRARRTRVKLTKRIYVRLAYTGHMALFSLTVVVPFAAHNLNGRHAHAPPNRSFRYFRYYTTYRNIF